MSKLRVLLTGDDGYQSHGTRLLVHLLRDHFDLTIAGTFVQQSGVGGKMSLSTGFNWGKTEVDGVPAFWVDGTPVDAVELMASYDVPKFDLAISGLNWGANLGTGVFSSGTFNAAMGALTRQASKKAMAISWDLPPAFYTMHHEKEHSLEDYLEYPGKSLKKLILQLVDQDLLGSSILNINFPYEPTAEVKVTKLLEDITQIYSRHDAVSGDEGEFSYKSVTRLFNKTIDPVYDVRALTDGFISITPCQLDLVEQHIFQKFQNIKFDLK